ncbi:MAG: hypothetical protein CME68_09295 [Halobacteriovoraceae bacterium]|nr:hypothetical protein [Halobacteriovoraceae bacterium]
MAQRKKIKPLTLKLILSSLFTFFLSNAFPLDDMGGTKLSKQIRFLENTFQQATRKGFLISSKTVRGERNYTAIYSGLTVGGLALHLTSKNRSVSFTSGLIAIQSTFGSWDMIFNRFYPTMDLALFRELPEGHKKLKLGEAILENAYKREVSIRSWNRRITGLLVNTLGGIAVWLGDERPMGGVVHFLLGTLIFESQRASVPTFASKRRAVYKSVFYNELVSEKNFWDNVSLMPIKDGIALNLSF